MVWVQEFSEEDPKTWKDIDPKTATMEEVYKKFGLDENTCDFVGHALALYRLNQTKKSELRKGYFGMDVNQEYKI